MRRFLLLAVLIAGCGEIEDVAEWVVPPANAREAYVRTLEDADLASSALAQDWLASAETAVVHAPDVSQAFRETVAIDAAGGASAWRVPVRRGQRVIVAVEGADGIFLDALGPLRSDETALLAHGDPKTGMLEVEPRADGIIVVRAQPPLLTSGHFTITMEVEPTLGFPVAGRSIADVGSIFGDPRDGGARDHHGIDIFAPRGTPVVAATAGTVSRVEETSRGGRVVWLRDARRSQSIYYAHLDSQIVTNGTRVEPGDTLGLVGNTGNARTTPPHLHFGVYSRGPQDPVPFVLPIRDRLPSLADDTALVGDRVRTAVDAPARDASGAASAERIPRGTLLSVRGAHAAWLRVTLPGGGTVFLRANDVESIERPLERVVPDGAVTLRASPAHDAAAIGTLAAGTGAPVYARFGDFVFIRTGDGPEGWISVGN